MAAIAAMSAAGEGIGMLSGGGALYQAQVMYKGAMAQTKRYFAANWAESSWRHTEDLHQLVELKKDVTGGLNGIPRPNYHKDMDFAFQEAAERCPKADRSRSRSRSRY